MFITTDRLLLRPYKQDDLVDYHDLNADPRLLTYELHKPFDVRETKRNLLYWMQLANERNTSFQTYKIKGKNHDLSIGIYEVGIELIAERRLIGLFSSRFTDIGSSVLEIGLRVNFDFQGQGYATEALKAVIEEVFETTDIHRIFGCTDARNKACIKVFENAGLQFEGRLRQNIRLPDDTYTDEVIYSILSENYKQ
jgi:RimJ/RimL family protein N-acetyltransferase